VVIADKFGLDPWTIAAQALNFLIVASVLYYFMFRPVLKTMDERREKIESGLKYAEEMKQKLAEAEKEQQAILTQARKEAQDILAQARTAAKTFEEAQTKDAATKVEQMIKGGREAIEQERAKAFAELRAEVSRLVVATTAKVLSRDLADAEKARLNQHAAEELARNN
jgi:F-type H+-transporting ATPase subunit b